MSINPVHAARITDITLEKHSIFYICRPDSGRGIPAVDQKSRRQGRRAYITFGYQPKASGKGTGSTPFFRKDLPLGILNMQLFGASHFDHGPTGCKHNNVPHQCSEERKKNVNFNVF